MRESEDVIRSVRRAVQSVLGSPPWRVLLAGDPGRTQRPYAIVSDTTTGATQAHSVPDTDEMTMPLVVYAYPLPGARPSESKLLAHRVGMALEWMIRAGSRDHSLPEVRGYQQRIPLFDYYDPNAGWLPLNAPDSDARLPVDYVMVEEGWSVQVRPDTDEGDAFVVVLTMRARWFRGAGGEAYAPPPPVLQDVYVGYSDAELEARAGS